MSKRILGRPPKQYCILCTKEIKIKDKKFTIAIDRPVRKDIVVHRVCNRKMSEKDKKTAIKQHIGEYL